MLVCVLLLGAALAAPRQKTRPPPKARSVPRKREQCTASDNQCIASQFTELKRYHISKLTRNDLDNAAEPFFIDGVTENWPAFDAWTAENIVGVLDGMGPFHLHDTHNESLRELLTERDYVMTHQVFPPDRCYNDPMRPYSPILSSSAFLDAVRVPRVLTPMSTWQAGIGISRGGGVPPENHPSSWFAMIIGEKRWVVHPPDPENVPPRLLHRHRSETDSNRHNCAFDVGSFRQDTLMFTQRSGDLLWLPMWWWHETCGVDAVSFGVGGITFPDCCRADQVHDCMNDPNEVVGHSYRVVDIEYCRENHCSNITGVGAAIV